MKYPGRYKGSDHRAELVDMYDRDGDIMEVEDFIRIQNAVLDSDVDSDRDIMAIIDRELDAYHERKAKKDL